MFFLKKPSIHLVEYHYQLIKKLSHNSDMEKDVFESYLDLNGWDEDSYYVALISLEESNK
jgi:hypothetical protein